MSSHLDSSSKNEIWLHRFAVGVSCSTFLLVIAGGLVTSTDSGLAVPDWPLSYGQLMPPMVGGIFYEHGHRLVAAAVGLLTMILAIWLWRADDRSWVRTLGWVALAAVTFQGVLGGLTVLFLLPTPISVLHATLAQSFFCLTIILALVTAPSWGSYKPVEKSVVNTTRAMAIASVAAVFVQLVLGAIMRHTQSGLAIPDFPLSYGQIIPPTHEDALSAINQQRFDLDLPPVELAQVWIHFAHRAAALIVSFILGTTIVHILTHYKSESRLREPVLLLLVLLIVQGFLGALIVWTERNIEAATAHVATGALLLGGTVLLTIRTFHFFKAPDRAPTPVLIPEASRP